jgi:hypothetical protein
MNYNNNDSFLQSFFFGAEGVFQAIAQLYEEGSF